MKNLEKLAAAGCADATKMTDADKALVEKLSDDEVDAIISANKKIGSQKLKSLHSNGNICL